MKGPTTFIKEVKNARPSPKSITLSLNIYVQSGSEAGLRLNYSFVFVDLAVLYNYSLSSSLVFSSSSLLSTCSSGSGYNSSITS